MNESYHTSSFRSLCKFTAKLPLIFFDTCLILLSYEKWGKNALCMAGCLHLVIFYFKSFVFQHTLASHLARPCQKNHRPLYLLFCLTRIVHSNSKKSVFLMKELFTKVSTVHSSHFVIFIFLQGNVFRHTLPCHLLGTCFLVLKKCSLSVVFALWRWDCWSVYPQF